jgi:hypothetical protein
MKVRSSTLCVKSRLLLFATSRGQSYLSVLGPQPETVSAARLQRPLVEIPKKAHACIPHAAKMCPFVPILSRLFWAKNLFIVS